GDEWLQVDLERQPRARSPVDARAEVERVLVDAGEDVAVAVRRRRGAVLQLRDVLRMPVLAKVVRRELQLEIGRGAIDERESDAAFPTRITRVVPLHPRLERELLAAV